MAEPSSPPRDRPVVRGYIDGCFDIMHSGHYNALRQAKALCDVLVVGVHSDEEIAENKAMPVMRQAERYGLLDHIKWIDEILYDVPYSPEIATLEKAGADFCIHGDDMPVNSQGVCAYDEMRNAGRLRIIKRTEGVSTTDLIGRLLTLSRHQHKAPHETSPTMGLRVTADKAIEQCSHPDLASGNGALATALRTLEKLAAEHRLPPAEAAALRSQICDAVATAAGGAGPQPAPLGPLALELAARTNAPVQLLASTRRIAEFATAKQPSAEDRVVYASGSFDMFHVGHAQFLKEARALGTFLLVGIHDDLSVSQAKGANYPVMNLNERVLNVCACKWVDEVIIGAPRQVTEDLIKTWDIHVVVRGTGHQRNDFGGSADTPFKVAERLGVYREIPSKWPELCHEKVVQRIISGRELYLNRNKDRARREDKYYAEKSKVNSPLEV